MEAILLFAQIVTGGAKVQGGAEVGTATTLPPILSVIDVNPINTVAGIGQTVNFQAFGTYAAPTRAIEIAWENDPQAHVGGTDITSQCTWTSSDSAVAAIGAKADPQPVTTVAAGTANITCTVGAVSGYGQLTVSGVVISPGAVPNATVNVPYTATFTAAGGTGPYTFSIINGLSQLNTAGLTLSGATLSGTPNATGTLAFEVQATDSATPSNTGTRVYYLVVQPPAGTNTRAAHLPQVWGHPHGADFPVPCNATNHCYQKFIHGPAGDTSGDYACSVTGLRAAADGWMAAPAGDYWEVIVDDGLSANRCAVIASTPLQLNAKLGAIGWLWFHSAHPTPVGQNPCGGWSAINVAVDQRTADCPAGKPHMWYMAPASNNQVTPLGNTIRLGPVDSAGNGPSHIRISNVEVESVGISNWAYIPVYTSTLNQPAGNLQAVCSYVGFDYSYFHANYMDNGVSATAPSRPLNSNFVMAGCRNSWFNWNYMDRIGYYQGESKPLSLTNLPPDAGMMLVGNWFEGGIYSFFVGGACSILGCDYIPSDVEFRKNYFAQNPAWIIGGGLVGGVYYTACGAGMSFKNLGEMKFGIRFLYDANVWQWNGVCGQYGQTLTLNARACSAGTPCDAYGTELSDIMLSNNVTRHAGNGIQSDPRSSGLNAGISVSKPGRRWNFINNLMYDIANNVNHRGNNPMAFQQTGGVVDGSLRWTCDGVRDSAGVVTLDCTNFSTRTITSVSVASTPTLSTSTSGTPNPCTANNCYIVTINFTPTTSWAPFSTPSDYISVENTVGATNLNSWNRTPCNSSTNCPAGSGSAFYYRCGASGEPACPTNYSGVNSGSLWKVGQRQTDHAPGDPTVVTGCADTTFNTVGGETTQAGLSPTGIPGPPALPGTNGVGPTGGAGGGLIVKYQSIPNAPASTTDCTFRNSQGWVDSVILSHNTEIGTDTSSPGSAGGAGSGSFRNPHPRGGTAAVIFPYSQNTLVQDNMDIVNPASNGGGTGWLCCNITQPEGQNTQRAGYALATSQLDHLTFAGRATQAANYRVYNPTCFAAGNCIAGNNYTANPPSTLWFPALGPCPGATVTTSGSGWVSGTSDNCPGFRGMMNGGTFLLDATPYNGTWVDPLTAYSLQSYNTVGSGSGNTCTSNCGSPYAAGGPREAHDHTDMGVDFNRMRHAQQRTIYDDCSAATGTCGAGPNPE